MTKASVHLWPRALAVLLLGAALPAFADVSASLDRDQIDDGETVTLVLKKSGSGGGDPDLAPLKADFDVLSTSSGSSIQLINGHFSSQTEVDVTLSPRHTGHLGIPPLSWGGEQSPALSLTVGAAGAGNGGGAGAGASGAPSNSGNVAGGAPSHVFLTTSLGDQQPYVQQPVSLVVELHTDQQLYQATLGFDGTADVAVQQIGKDERNSETRNGHNYMVVRRRYLLTPQHSGSVRIEGPVLDAQVQDQGGNPFGMPSMFNTMHPLRLHGDAIVLAVRARPPGATGHDWLPARQLTVEQSWKPDAASIKAGEPLTLHLRMMATGLAGAQLPDLSAELNLPDGLKAYPDQPKIDTSVQGDSIVGTREQDIALIADHPGHYRIPELKIGWWDVGRDQAREAVLPERELEVTAAAGVAPPAGGAAPAAGDAAPAGDDSAAASAAATPIMPASAVSAGVWSGIWPWIATGMAAGWALTALAWLLSLRRGARPAAGDQPASPPLARDAGPARRAFQQACASNNARAAREALLAWAGAVWTVDGAPWHGGLNAVADRLDSASAALVRALDRACFADAPWQGKPLADALSELPINAASSRKAPLLKPLYH